MKLYLPFDRWDAFNLWASKHSKDAIPAVVSDSVEIGRELILYGGKYKGQAAVIQDYTKSKVYVTLPQEGHRVVLLSRKSVFGFEVEVKKDDAKYGVGNESGASLKKGEHVTIVRGKYKNEEGIVDRCTSCMVYIVKNDGIIVRVMKTSLTK